MTCIIGVRHLAEIISKTGLDEFLDELITRLADALASHDPEVTETETRRGFHYAKPDMGLLEWMPAHEIGRAVAIKTVGYHPTNPVQRGIPSVLATTSLYDTTTGHLVAVVEATILTALRTGAASAVATDILGHPEASVLGLVGCGAQAVTQAHAISRVRPIQRILAFDADSDVAASFADRVDFLGAEVEVVPPEQVDRLVGTVDVLCTATSVGIGEGPVIPDAPHLPWLHVNAVGADFTGKTELPRRILERSLLCPDHRDQCLLEGEAQQVGPEGLGPDLPQLVRERHRFEAARTELTVFDSTGWSLEDLVAAELVVEHARRLGVGVECDLQDPGRDPYDPYEALR